MMEYIQKFETLTFCSLFHELAEKNAAKTAVSGGGKSYTYRELDEYSTDFAGKLLKAGLKQEEIAALKLGRSADILLSILAVWKAGGAYLFLDDCYPHTRNEKLLSEAECSIIIDESYISRQHLKRDPGFFDLSKRENTAVLIYTSGSTSFPKGVVIEHRNIMASISNAERLGISEHDKVCVFPSYSFVASIYDTFGTLSHGGSIDIIPEEDRRHILMIEKYFIDHDITLAYLPPHMARKIESDMNPDLKLRALLVGGEIVRNLRPDALPILNVYAATETCSLAVTYLALTAQQVYPIGRPNPNLRAYIVDESGNPVRKGEKGELWLAGPQIARGYFKRPEETARNFIPNPFCNKKGYDRVFRTSDLTHELDDGNLMFDGRLDSMLKIRGFRVESGAVESVIMETAAVKEVVVTSFTDSGGTDILCGFFTSDEDIDVKKLKEKLRDVLPYYMIPTALIRLDEMPININRKIDRKALKPPKELDDHKLLEKLY